VTPLTRTVRSFRNTCARRRSFQKTLATAVSPLRCCNDAVSQVKRSVLLPMLYVLCWGEELQRKPRLKVIALLSKSGGLGMALGKSAGWPCRFRAGVPWGTYSTTCHSINASDPTKPFCKFCILRPNFLRRHRADNTCKSCCVCWRLVWKISLRKHFGHMRSGGRSTFVDWVLLSNGII
jgi:hypothetical protein